MRRGCHDLCVAACVATFAVWQKNCGSSVLYSCMQLSPAHAPRLEKRKPNVRVCQCQRGLAAWLQVFGCNSLKEVPLKSFFSLVWENLQDPILLLLIAAALVGEWGS